MQSLLLDSCSETIRRLASELAELESQLGRPGITPDVEARVIEVAHQLRNELQIQSFTEIFGDELSLHDVDSVNTR